MINSEVFIIKRDGKKETFSLDKIKNAIAKAFLSVGSFATQDVITTVLSRVSFSDGMNVEEIKNQVEFLAPVVVLPGEGEMRSLAFNALGALNGELPIQEYV